MPGDADARPDAPVPPHRERFAVHSYEADAFGALAPPALSGWLQEAAGQHAELLGVGIEALQARGLGWVLSRQKLELDRPIHLGDEVEVATWPTGADRLAAVRDFELRRGGEVVGRAVTQWIVLDLRTRRPVRLDRVLAPALLEPRPHVLEPAGDRPPLPAGELLERRFSIRYRDIDRNLHVTNASYVAWATEAVPQEEWRALRLRALEVHFLAECALGSAVLSRSAPAGADVRLHAVVREEDGRELARLRTAWVAREG